MHRHEAFLGALGCLMALLAATFALGEARRAASDALTGDRVALASALALTDLAVWTEARYTRNPALTDFFTPFQDVPGGPEHFPAGALLAPPEPLLSRGGEAGGCAP